MPYDTQNILTSEKPYQVFKELLEKEEGSYGSEIARELDIKQQSASEIISRLNERGILQKGKRTRAQYYELDRKGLSDTFVALWAENIEEGTEQYKALKKMEKNQEAPIVPRDHLRMLLTLYVYYYTDSESESTIKKMLVDDFYDELEFLIHASDYPGDLTEDFQDVEIPEWLRELHALLKYSLLPVNVPQNLRGALLDYSDRLED